MERAPFGGRILTHLLFTRRASTRMQKRPLQPPCFWLFSSLPAPAWVLAASRALLRARKTRW